MAAATVPTVVTKVSPATAWKTESFDRFQFFKPHSKPVSPSHREADGTEANDHQLSFDDVTRCHVQQRVSCRRRRLSQPLWAVNTTAQRKLLCYYFQKRCNIRKPIITDDPVLQKSILRSCQEHLEKDINPWLLADLDKLCQQFVSTTDPKMKLELSKHIRAADTRLRANQRGCGFILRIIHSYYSLGYSSKETGELLNVSALMIRQILHRLAISWAELSGEVFTPHHWHRSESERPKLEPRAARQQNIRRAIVAHKLCAAQKRLAAAQAELAELLASHEQFISERVERARQTYERRQARANAEVAAVRERVLSLAVGVL